MTSASPAPGLAVPVIDISAYRTDVGAASARAAVAAQVDDAARTLGFMQITGHGIPAPVWDGLGAAIDAFFALPMEAKRTYTRPAGVNRGYTAPRSERLSLSLGLGSTGRMNDFFEAFNAGIGASAYPGISLPADDYAETEWPRELPAFRPAVEAWLQAVGDVGRRLLAIIAEALDLSVGFFDAYLTHPVEVLRMNNYALPAGEAVDPDQDLVGMGEHTDYGIITLLWADDVPGLQILGPDRRWQDVAPLPGALLVNLGDLTARWTNDRWKSTLHRVKPPVLDGTIRRRRSAAYFLDGDIEAVVSTLPGCLDAEGRTSYPPITIADHLRAKLTGSRGLSANTTGTEREAARVVSARA